MKLCPQCGQGLSLFGSTAVTCILCDTGFCTGCEETFRKEPRGPDEHQLCKSCFSEFDDDEVIGFEITCPKCQKEYFMKTRGSDVCRCGEWFGKLDGSWVKQIVLSCPECEHDADPFKDRILTCVLCDEMFCSDCEASFRSAARGEGLFPVCRTCFSNLKENETVMLDVVCSECDDSFRFFDPSKISTLHGERMRQSDPFPVRCKCGTFHDIEEGEATVVTLGISWDSEIILRENGHGDDGLRRHSGDGVNDLDELDAENEGLVEDDELVEDVGEQRTADLGDEELLEELIDTTEEYDNAGLFPGFRGRFVDRSEQERGELQRKGPEEIMRDASEGLHKESSIDPSSEIHCEACGYLVSQDARFCSQCGAEFE